MTEINNTIKQKDPKELADMDEKEEESIRIQIEFSSMGKDRKAMFPNELDKEQIEQFMIDRKTFRYYQNFEDLGNNKFENTNLSNGELSLTTLKTSLKECGIEIEDESSYYIRANFKLDYKNTPKYKQYKKGTEKK